MDPSISHRLVHVYTAHDNTIQIVTFLLLCFDLLIHFIKLNNCLLSS